MDTILKKAQALEKALKMSENHFFNHTSILSQNWINPIHVNGLFLQKFRTLVALFEIRFRFLFFDIKKEDNKVKSRP